MGQIGSHANNKKEMLNEKFLSEVNNNKEIAIYFADIDRLYNIQASYSSFEGLKLSLLNFFCIPNQSQPIISEDQTEKDQLRINLNGLHDYSIKLDLILNKQNTIEFQTLKFFSFFPLKLLLNDLKPSNPQARLYRSHDLLYSDPLNLENNVIHYFSQEINELLLVVNYIKSDENYQIVINHKSNKVFMNVDRNMRIAELTSKFSKDHDANIILCNADSGLKIEDDFLMRTLVESFNVSSVNAVDFEDYYRSHNYYAEFKKLQESSYNKVELIDMPD